MPWAVKKDGKRWAIVRSDTGEVVGHSATKAMAEAAVRARYANVEGEVEEAHRRAQKRERR